MIAAAVQAWGAVDVLVNCAGIVRDRTFLRTTEADFAAVLRAVLGSTFHACQAAAAVMVPRRAGGIVNTVGAASLHGNLAQSAYSAAAAGVYGLTRTLAAELKKHDILVNALCPIARTRATEDLPMFAPDGGLGDDSFGPQFVAPAALFLASSLSGDTAGETLSVAGTSSRSTAQESHGVVGEDPARPGGPTTSSRAGAPSAAFADLADPALGGVVGGEIALDAQLLGGDVGGRAQGGEGGEEPQRDRSAAEVHRHRGVVLPPGGAQRGAPSSRSTPSSRARRAGSGSRSRSRIVRAASSAATSSKFSMRPRSAPGCTVAAITFDHTSGGASHPSAAQPNRRAAPRFMRSTLKSRSQSTAP